MRVVARNATVLLLFNFYVFGCYFNGLVCNLFVRSVIVARPMGQAILSSLSLGISSLLVPYRLSIALSHVLELCQIIQLLKQMRLLLHKSIQLLKHKTP